jgi:PhnB protein
MTEAATRAAAPPVVRGVTPYLTVRGAAAAIDFYKLAFGAVEIARMPAPDGVRLIHAHLRINDDDLLMSDDFGGAGGDDPGDPCGVTLHLQVDDADRWWARALAAGAQVKMPIAAQFWGDRYGQIKDPFGHTWSIGGAAKG